MQKRGTMDKLDFPGAVLTHTAEVLIVYSQQPLPIPGRLCGDRHLD